VGKGFLTPVLSGYGPVIVGASSASVPFFEGKREDFADFSYKLRAVLLEHNIDDIIFNPTAFQKQVEMVQRVRNPNPNPN
jgi:hypothetical protein